MAKIKHKIEDYKPDPRLVDERGATPERIGKLRQSPINTMLEAKKITREQALAAEKFYIHWHRGGLMGNMPSPDLMREVFGAVGGNVLPMTENAIFHRDRFEKIKNQIIKQLGGLSFWVAEQIILHEKPFCDVGALLGHKNRTRQAQISFEILKPVLNLMGREWGVT